MAISPHEKFVTLRSIIENEDNLINHRFTWLLLIESLLTAGVVNGYFDQSINLIYIIGGLGALLSFMFGISILGAKDSIEACKVKWDRIVENVKDENELINDLPDITFKTKYLRNYTTVLQIACFILIPVFWFSLSFFHEVKKENFSQHSVVKWHAYYHTQNDKINIDIEANNAPHILHPNEIGKLFEKSFCSNKSANK
jgi:hypothetical protein